MRTRLLFAFLLFLSLIVGSQLNGQRTNVSSFSQSMDITSYRGKRFRFSAAVKAIPTNKDALARIWIRVDRSNQQMGVFENMGNQPIRNGDWKVYSISNTIDLDGEKLFFGGIFENGGGFLFDDIKLEIEMKPNQWEMIPLPNGGFETWDKEGYPTDWNGGYKHWVNYVAVPSTEDVFEGTISLKIITDGYDVKNKNLTTEIYREVPMELIPLQGDLANGYIWEMTQDDKGFIWIGTDQGLARYDGYEFKSFLYDPLDSTSISDNSIRKIHQAPSGRLWIGTQSGGLNLYDPEKEAFIRYMHDQDDSLSLSHNTVTAIYEDREGYIWVGGLHGKGLNRIDPETGTCKRYLPSREKYGLQSRGILDIKEDRAGNLWLGTHGFGLVMLERETDQFHSYFTQEDYMNGSGTNYIYTIHEDQDSLLWLGSENGLYRFDPVNRQFIDSYHHEPSNDSDIHKNIFAGLKIDQNGNPWFTHQSGIGYLDVDNFQFHFLESDNVIYEGNYTSIVIDQEGLMWFGTSDGIARLNTHKLPFSDKSLMKSIPRTLEDVDFIYTVFQDSEQFLWYVTPNGLFKVNPKTGNIVSFQKEKGNPQSLPSNYVLSIHEDKNQNIWFSLSNEGLSKWDRATNSIKNFGTKDLASFRYIFAIESDESELLWLGTWSGVVQFDPVTDEIRRLEWRRGDQKWTRVNTLFRDSNQDLWVGTSFGEVKRYDQSKKSFEDHSPDPEDVFIDRGRGTINSFFESSDGTFYIATDGKGMYAYDRETKKYDHYTVEEGLPNNKISSFLEDEDGDLWISTQGGLAVLNDSSGRFRHFNSVDGLPSNLIYDGLKEKETGAFIYSTKEGLLVFDPDDIKLNTDTPSIVITSLDRYHPDSKGKPISVTGIAHQSKINLSYKDDLLSFRFATLSYAKSPKNQYAYRMIGLQEDWIQLGTDRKVTFTNLPPGRYTLHVKGSNGDGVWNEEGTKLEIYVAPPWYWSPFSKWIYALLIIGAIYAFFQYRTANLRRQKRKLESKVKERTAEVVAQKEVIQQEKQRSDELLLNILPASVAEELKQTGAAQAQRFDTVTVLFTDFRQFTQHAERLSPEELVQEIDHCFKAFDRILGEHSVEKIKTIGDAYMAAAGLPTPNQSNPEDAVKAALAIRDFMLQYKTEREAQGRIPFEIRIGVHTGPVVAGIVGIKKFSYDIWGDTVNLAARMETSGEVGKVNISQSTWEHLKDRPEFSFSSRGKIEAKHKGEVEMYFVERNS